MSKSNLLSGAPPPPPPLKWRPGHLPYLPYPRYAIVLNAGVASFNDWSEM